MMNPLQMMQMLRGSQNPMQTMMQLSRQNPQLNQIMQMTNGKTPAQMEQMVRPHGRESVPQVRRLSGAAECVYHGEPGGSDRRADPSTGPRCTGTGLRRAESQLLLWQSGWRDLRRRRLLRLRHLINSPRDG